MPNLDVIERYPHSKWRAYYYWDKIMWDDAAMFENSMKFIVKIILVVLYILEFMSNEIGVI